MGSLRLLVIVVEVKGRIQLLDIFQNFGVITTKIKYSLKLGL